MALREAVERLASVQGPSTYRQVAAAAQVGFDSARSTLKHMVEAGELKVSGYEKVAGSTQWNALLELPDGQATPQAWGGIEALADVMRTFPATVE